MSRVTINRVHIDVLEDVLHLVRTNGRCATKSLAQLREDWSTRQGLETLKFDVGSSVVCLEENVANNDSSDSDQHVWRAQGQAGKDAEHVDDNNDVTEQLNRQQLIN